ncbi:hypothetical protein RE428_23550 [Marinobacter nanhaiticus D15-8W]|uniref:GGDEF domain-containing protein n=1 Tax=Marinobacter nanhaiticus D15-8W TaxID=626887 RepID=N6W1H5_9GAMM|nr:EAL domain-containing protein [Marinobacter nanhaiticus]ENO13959.1 GGDEF domain-containing protein [Marinobacter nanhaiticus D15-8W]BES71337.1 hypothetical protein RE428_23550 [Marinobacter nanhaiticus D15-8W]
MRLPDFIRSNMEEILRAWEKNAAGILPARNYSREELRDHIRHVLAGICAEMDKDAGLRHPADGVKSTGSYTQSHARYHGAERHDLGAGIVQVTREFRALRTTVIKFWRQSDAFGATPTDFDEIAGFYKAVDKALIDSAEQYASRKEKQGRLFETMLSSLPDPCYVLSLEGEFLYANRAIASLCGLTRTDLIGRKFEEFDLPESYNSIDHVGRVVESKHEVRGEVEIDVGANQVRHFEYVYAPVLDAEDNVEAVSGVAHDVTEHRQSEAEVWHHANYDYLTGVPNRRLFLDRLDQHANHSKRTNEPFAVMFIDLDRFKEVNDQLGHDAGDILLRNVAQRIEANIRESDTVARHGGDEFTVLLLDGGRTWDVKALASNILRDLSEPFTLNDDTVAISASIGITLFPEDANTVKQLLNNADQAMYLAKSSGRNQICFYRDLLVHSMTSRLELLSDLREARQKNQFTLHYQPIVDLGTGRVTKAEALLRWEHPKRGLLAPEQFLELVEEAGLMHELEQWIFSEVASTASPWGNLSSEPLEVAINVSAKEFVRNTLDMPWEAHLGLFADSNMTVAVELTEDVFLGEMDRLNDRFARLQQTGVQLALDDFGTGYSSLASLKKFNVNYLKIDQSFIKDNGGDISHKAIAESIIVMAHKLGLKVIAEGVETLEQHNWLRDAGCDLAQGYLFSPPVPASSMELLLKRPEGLPPTESSFN